MDLRSLAWLIDQLFHSHQSQCVLTLIPVGTCNVLPFVPGNDGNPRTIYDLFGNSQTTTLKVNNNSLFTNLMHKFFILQYIYYTPLHVSSTTVLTNLMHKFFIFQYIYYTPLHVSRTTVLILRRTNCTSAASVI